MLLTIFFCYIALTLANPFHKFPYVFLLDVGNEELEKTNTEQLRVSIPGGSLAMKYPVMGEGDTISHVRVSGIDFGTDLKVNIVDGGPGYKYVVLVFMGNPGVSYDAVVTLQTLPPGTEINTVNKKQVVGPKTTEDSKSYEVTDVDSDDNDENIAGSTIMKQYSQKSNSEVMQSSSKLYNYANAEMAENDKEDESENTPSEEQDDDNDSSKEDEEDSDSSSDEDESVSGEENEDDGVEEKAYFKQSGFESPRAEQYTYNIADSNAYDKPADIVDDSLYEKYQDLKPHFADGYRVYPQSAIYNKQYQNSYGKNDEVELEQMFNDEEIHNDGRYKDGSNSIDSDYPAAEY
ncbi:uncharacterized protein [Epargyreus clarus]|uniref:uncharacterized protein n=1 Tax=Epargyreus clarus TaxID=520877 RepID=UPI003C2C808F